MYCIAHDLRRSSVVLSTDNSSSGTGIIVRNLVKFFGSNRVVDNVSFEVPNGELVALLGPSGGGKSTVLRIIAGLEEPDAGEVFLNGNAATKKRVQERAVGFVFQHYALFRHLTVRQNIAFGLQVKKRPRAEVDATVRELLDLVQLGSLGDRYPAQLSGGQRQRVALARALAPKPSLLLLDEPFGALDAKVRVELREWIRRLHKERNITSVFVTHDQEEAMDLADRVIVLHKGRVDQIGTPEEIYDHPATEFVASFVGSNNVLKGQVKDGQASLGSLAVHAPPGAGEGASVRAFVRPYDIELKGRIDTADEDRQTGNGGKHLATARIERMSRIGNMVKIDLQLSDGQPLAVELSRDRATELALTEGDLVMVNLREARLFVQDYTI
jgi:sulfate transport system ATP-binding protein